MLVLLAQLNAQNTGLAATAGVTSLSTSTDILGIIGRVLNIGLGLLGVIVLGLILWAGWKWMTADGKGEQVADAQKMLLNAVIGMLIIFSAAAISRFVISQLSIATHGTPTLTQGSDDPWNVNATADDVTFSPSNATMESEADASP